MNTTDALLAILERPILLSFVDASWFLMPVTAADLAAAVTAHEESDERGFVVAVLGDDQIARFREVTPKAGDFLAFRSAVVGIYAIALEREIAGNPLPSVWAAEELTP